MQTITAALQISMQPFQAEGTGWYADFLLADDFPGFAGHFPDHPVLPAVVQIRMARLLLETALRRPCCLAGVPQAKFIQPIPPETPIRVAIFPGTRPQVWECRIGTPAGMASQFRIKELTSC